MPTLDATVQPDAAGELAERDRLDRLLDRLPIEQRAVIVLHFYVGLPLTEAAEVLDIPEGTAKSRLHRGLSALRTAVAAEPVAPSIPARERLA